MKEEDLREAKNHTTPFRPSSGSENEKRLCAQGPLGTHNPERK
jgi:hypothetical protein